MMKIISICLILSLLSACAHTPTWSGNDKNWEFHPGENQKEFVRDRGNCELEAEKTMASESGSWISFFTGLFATVAAGAGITLFGYAVDSKEVQIGGAVVSATAPVFAITAAENRRETSYARTYNACMRQKGYAGSVVK